MEQIDLFESQENLPVEVWQIINDFAIKETNYEDCIEMQIKLQRLGYDFEYGLDAVPFNLHKIYKRPDLSYLSQAQTINIGKMKTKHVAIQFMQNGKIQGAAACSDDLVKAIENIPGLVQVAEMYFDSMGSSMKGTLPYEITKELLERLKQ